MSGVLTILPYMPAKRAITAKATQELLELAVSPRKPPQPFLRWAGGKRRLTGLLIQAFPTEFDPRVNRFFEPFIGGGALMFATGNKSSDLFIPGKNVFINDSNPDLVIVYKVIKYHLPELLKVLKKLSKNLGKEEFERIRSSSPRTEIARAARFIYLNKTCFNGLWRVNSSGQFNVPWGKLVNPLIFDQENLEACSKRLIGAKISCGSFTQAVETAKKGDLVYFDPPYLPLSPSSSFSQYAKDNFNTRDHEKLAEVISNLTDRGVSVILSNSDTPETRRIFDKLLTLRQISVNRSISAAAHARKPVNEVIGTNFQVKRGTDIAGLKVISRSS
jgi:DNA adenine methylase